MYCLWINREVVSKLGNNRAIPSMLLVTFAFLISELPKPFREKKKSFFWTNFGWQSNTSDRSTSHNSAARGWLLWLVINSRLDSNIRLTGMYL